MRTLTIQTKKGLHVPRKSITLTQVFKPSIHTSSFFPEFKKSGFDSSYISFMNLNEELQQITSFMLSW